MPAGERGLPLVAPSVDDPLVGELSAGVGGPFGAHAGAWRGFWRPERVLVALVGVAAVVMVLAKQHCRAVGFVAPDVDVHACYSDIPPLYAGRGIAAGAFPYLSVGDWAQVEYPVIIGLVMWVTGRITAGLAGLLPAGANPAVTYFDVNLVLLVAWLVVTVWATARAAGRRPYDAALVALAPGIMLAGTINWDLWAVGLTALALAAWAGRRPGVAGVALGLGTATKFYPLLVFGPLLVLCWRTGRMREFWRALGAGVGVWLVVNLPFILANAGGWAEFYRMSRTRGAGFGSVWLVAEHLGVGVDGRWLNLVASGLFAVACLAIAVVGLTAPRRPRLASLTFLVVAAFILTNKVYSPQFVVWLVPLAALARPRWRDFLIWQAAEVAHFLATWAYLGGNDAPNRALPVAGYDFFIVAHVAATVYLAVLVVRDIYRPGFDPVRAGGDVDDPGGGVLDGAPDARGPWLGRHSALPDDVGVQDRVAGPHEQFVAPVGGGGPLR
jgi:uncharacterized membrane protein